MPPSDRAAWVIDQIDSRNTGLGPEVLAEKHGVMADSPFAFYRATNHLFWADQGRSPDLEAFGGTAATRTWLQGDLHPDNYGAFDDHRGSVVYDLDDFDEAVIGDYQLDLWRMATAIVLVSRLNGFPDGDGAEQVERFTSRYLEAVEGFARRADAVSSGPATAETTYGQLDDFLVRTSQTGGRERMLDRWAPRANGVRAFRPAANPDLAEVDRAGQAAIRAAFTGDRYGGTLAGSGWSARTFRINSIARRLHAGVGSLGATRYYLLIEGDTTGQDDDRILDVKAQGAPSAWGRIDPAAQAATSERCGGNHARRVVTAHRCLGTRVDERLGWVTIAGQEFSVRERSPFKAALDLSLLSSTNRLGKLAEQWGGILAAAHCRADRDSAGSGIASSFEDGLHQTLRGRCGRLTAAIRAKALADADQVVADHGAFTAWLQAGGG